jgi:hypothetical protein
MSSLATMPGKACSEVLTFSPRPSLRLLVQKAERSSSVGETFAVSSKFHC